jgi:hypothetical protein
MMNDCDLARVRPGICVFDKPSSNRILADVIPFLRIAFCTSQNVIEKSPLPDRVARIIALYGFTDNAFERAHPTPKSYVRWNRHEKMQVVWQNYISANCHSQIPQPSLTKLEEGGVDWMICKQSPPPICAARDEVQWVMCVNQFQSSRRTGKLRHSRSVIFKSDVGQICRHRPLGDATLI